MKSYKKHGNTQNINPSTYNLSVPVANEKSKGLNESAPEKRFLILLFNYLDADNVCKDAE